MHCAEEVNVLRRSLEGRDGVLDLLFDVVSAKMTVHFSYDKIRPAEIERAIEDAGMQWEAWRDSATPGPRDRRSEFLAATAGACLLGALISEGSEQGSFLIAVLLHGGENLPPVAKWSSAGAIAAGAALVAPKAWRAVRHRRPDMSALVAMSLAGAVFLGEWLEGAMLAFLFSVAQLLETRSLARARDSIGQLLHGVPGHGEGHFTAPGEQFLDHFARRYTSLMLVLAVSLAVLPPLFDGAWRVWLYRALLVLLISCPCALVISTPVTIAAALASAARRGVLIKKGVYLQMAAGGRHSLRVAERGSAAGTIDSADVVVLDNAGDSTSFLELHGRRTVAVIRQNVALALASKAAFLILAALGVATLWMAVIADVGATVLVTLNGLRMLRG